MATMRAGMMARVTMVTLRIVNSNAMALLPDTPLSVMLGGSGKIVWFVLTFGIQQLPPLKPIDAYMYTSKLGHRWFR